MRFVFVSETPDRIQGGIERHAAAMVAELARRGHAARVVRPTELRRRDAAAAQWLVFDGVARLTILRHARRTRMGPGLVLFPHGSFLESAHPPRGGDRLSAGRTGTTLLRRAFDSLLGRRVFGRFDRWFPLADGESLDIRALFGVPPNRVTVEGPFVSSDFLDAVAQPPAPTLADGPYVCSISRVERRKNYRSLLAALDGSRYRFVLGGQDRGGLAELQAASRQMRGSRWEYRGTVSEPEKVALIRGATAVVIPSVREGVPALALEALVLGRPVILAGTAYGPTGPGVVRCDPDPRSLREALDELPWDSQLVPRTPPTVAGAVDRFLAALDDAVRPLGSEAGEEG